MHLLVRCGTVENLTSLLSHFHHSTFFATPGDYLQDKSAGGKRKAAEEAEEEDDSDDDSDEEDTMPAKKPAAKGTPKTPKTPKTPANDKDIDDIVDRVQSQLDLGSWYMVDRNQHFGIMALVFTNPSNQTRYVHIRVELIGSIKAEHIEASMTEDGASAKIKVKFPRGGELTNPMHLLCRYPNMTDDHPLYGKMRDVHRFYGEANEKKEEEVVIKLPFPCVPHGFYDPIEENDEFLDLGVFPLEDDPTEVSSPASNSSGAGEGPPAPSTKFLFLYCEEQKKAKIEQKTQQRAYGFRKTPQSGSTRRTSGGSSPMGTP